MESLNNFIIKLSDSPAIVCGVILAILIKPVKRFLNFCGAEIFDGMIQKGIDKIKEQLIPIFDKRFSVIDEDIVELKKGLKIYKQSYHDASNAKYSLEQAILAEDEALTNKVVKLLKERHDEKK